MQEAQQALKDGQYEKSVELFKQYIELNKQYIELNKQYIGKAQNERFAMAVLNLGSAYFSLSQYQNCMSQCSKYVQICKQDKVQAKVQAYTLYCRCLIKLKKLLTHQQHHFMSEGQNLFPQHKVLQQAVKIVKQLQISQNQDEYMDKIFEKLLSHPKLRNYMTEQSFLTKVQKIIRNPSLAGALSKTDKRLEQVTEMILMAQEQEQGENNKPKQK